MTPRDMSTRAGSSHPDLTTGRLNPRKDFRGPPAGIVAPVRFLDGQVGLTFTETFSGRRRRFEWILAILNALRIRSSGYRGHAG